MTTWTWTRIKRKLSLKSKQGTELRKWARDELPRHGYDVKKGLRGRDGQKVKENMIPGLYVKWKEVEGTVKRTQRTVGRHMAFVHLMNRIHDNEVRKLSHSEDAESVSSWHGSDDDTAGNHGNEDDDLDVLEVSDDDDPGLDDDSDEDEIDKPKGRHSASKNPKTTQSQASEPLTSTEITHNPPSKPALITILNKTNDLFFEEFSDASLDTEGRVTATSFAAWQQRVSEDTGYDPIHDDLVYLCWFGGARYTQKITEPRHLQTRIDCKGDTIILYIPPRDVIPKPSQNTPPASEKSTPQQNSVETDIQWQESDLNTSPTVILTPDKGDLHENTLTPPVEPNDTLPQASRQLPNSPSPAKRKRDTTADEPVAKRARAEKMAARSVQSRLSDSLKYRTERY